MRLRKTRSWRSGVEFNINAVFAGVAQCAGQIELARVFVQGVRLTPSNISDRQRLIVAVA
ncbi:MAG: hypothetical protein KIG85_09215 [Thiopseudomonas sp.]|nr:hypothetical protein [Thiopseudomonas sp.]